MKLIKRVKTIEVKRAFVIPQMIRKLDIKSSTKISDTFKSNKRLIKDLPYSEFRKKLKLSKNIILKLKEEKLNKIISDEYKKRLTAYNNSDWYLGEVTPKEIGVWRRASGLPLDFTNGSLDETSKKVENALNKNSKIITKRAKYSISNILKTNVYKLQNEKYLFPIIFEGGKGTKGRKRLKRQMKGDIDDGCMRSIALTIAGVKKIKAYIGIEKKSK